MDVVEAFSGGIWVALGGVLGTFWGRFPGVLGGLFVRLLQCLVGKHIIMRKPWTIINLMF